MLDVYPAREEPVGELAGVSGLDVARAAADRDGREAGLAGADARRRPRAALERRGSAPGDVLVTIGAGDVFKLGEALVGTGSGDERRPPGVERDFPLARLTTVRTGGDADWFARPATEERAGRAAGLGRARGARDRRGRLGLEPAGRRRRLPRPRDQARRRAGRRSSARASGCSAAAARAFPRRRRRPPAGGCPGSSSGSTSPARSAAR